MNRLFQAAIATCAFLVFPQFASAGAVPWSYSTSIVGVNGNFNLNLGVHQFIIDDGTTASGPFDFYVTQPLPQAFNAPLSFDGSATEIRLATMSNHGGTEVSQTPPTVAADDMFKLTMTIYGSGLQVATFDFYGRVQLLAGSTLSDPMYLEIVGDGHAHTTLNGSHFDIRVYGGNTDTGTQFLADVTVTTGTPEPGTLALAAIGLGAIGFRFRRFAQPA